MRFLIKVHKIDCFSKKTLKILEKSANIMYLCKGGQNRRFCSFGKQKMHPAGKMDEFSCFRNGSECKTTA